MALVLEQTDTLPSVSRGTGRSSEETNQLKDAVSSKTPIRIAGVNKDGFNALQQKIRYAAREVGLKVSIRRHNETDDAVDVHFQGMDKVIKTDDPKPDTKKVAAKTSAK
jgi:hypothetical protein